MPKIDVPNEEEKKIMEENGLDPSKFCVTFRDETTIALRNYKTRDDVTIRFPTYNVNLGDACVIVKSCLDDDTIAFPSKVIAIEKVARMETHNSITKDDLVHCLRWLFDYYDFK